ncbi:MAG: cell division protein FtsB [Piscirickettsiaceae bacterium]|nr:cell division protein FtsB [Piscirickettsiaceae bacterium]
MKLVMMVLTAMLIILQYRLWFSHDGIPSILHLNLVVKIQQQNNALLKERNQVITVEVLDLKNGLDALEESARSELGMIRQGETFFQIIKHNDGE